MIMKTRLLRQQTHEFVSAFVNIKCIEYIPKIPFEYSSFSIESVCYQSISIPIQKIQILWRHISMRVYLVYFLKQKCSMNAKVAEEKVITSRTPKQIDSNLISATSMYIA
ncbi:hypothetical protein BLOT_005092 [Blomia tropicalis]|nr:hypothetical protein BLOT_005092 [Blomia tropicalis]